MTGNLNSQINQVVAVNIFDHIKFLLLRFLTRDVVGLVSSRRKFKEFLQTFFKRAAIITV